MIFEKFSKTAIKLLVTVTNFNLMNLFSVISIVCGILLGLMITTQIDRLFNYRMPSTLSSSSSSSSSLSTGNMNPTNFTSKGTISSNITKFMNINTIVNTAVDRITDVTSNKSSSTTNTPPVSVQNNIENIEEIKIEKPLDSHDQRISSLSSTTTTTCPYDFTVYVYDIPITIDSIRISKEARKNHTLHVCHKCILEQFSLEYIVYDFFINFCGRTFNPKIADYFYLPIIRDAEFRYNLNKKGNRYRQSSLTEQALIDIIEKNDSTLWKLIFNITDQYWYQLKIDNNDDNNYSSSTSSTRRSGSSSDSNQLYHLHHHQNINPDNNNQQQQQQQQMYYGYNHIIVMPAPVTNLRHETSQRGYFHYMFHLYPPIFLNLEYSLQFSEEYPICTKEKNIVMPYPTIDYELFNGNLYSSSSSLSSLLSSPSKAISESLLLSQSSLSSLVSPYYNISSSHQNHHHHHHHHHTYHTHTNQSHTDLTHTHNENYSLVINETRKYLLYYAGGLHGDCMEVRKAMKIIMKNCSLIHHHNIIPPHVKSNQAERENGFISSTFCPIPIGKSCVDID
jgi:hypothetical protein